MTIYPVEFQRRLEQRWASRIEQGLEHRTDALAPRNTSRRRVRAAGAGPAGWRQASELPGARGDSGVAGPSGRGHP